MTGWMCPLKRDKPGANGRVGYETLTHCRLYCGDGEQKYVMN